MSAERGDYEATYAFVSAFVERHGYSPSHREIAQGAGLASTSVVAHHLARLREQGRVSYVPNTTRTVRPVGVA